MDIQTTVHDYLALVRATRSTNTATTYRKALQAFYTTTGDNVTESSLSVFLDSLRDHTAAKPRGHSVATERTYTAAVVGFYRYLAAENIQPVNLALLKQIVSQRSRRAGKRLPAFPRAEIEKVLFELTNNQQLTTKNRRDRAFILTLADTGLRVSEACNLRYDDIDWTRSRFNVIGKGDKQASVRFTPRVQNTLLAYLSDRTEQDGRIFPFTPTTGRNIIKDYSPHLHPHHFRHYFVTTMLEKTGSIEKVQKLARHENIATTLRYTHLQDKDLDAAYDKLLA